MSMKKQDNMLDRFFNLRQGDLLEEMKEDREALKSSLKQLNDKKLHESMSQLPQEYDQVKKQIYQYIEDLANDYEIKMAYYDSWFLGYTHKWHLLTWHCEIGRISYVSKIPQESVRQCNCLHYECLLHFPQTAYTSVCTEDTEGPYPHLVLIGK